MSIYFVSIHSSAAENRKKSLKTPIWGIQGHSKLSMLIPPKSTSLVLVMIRSTFVPICKRFRAKQANSAKITTF